MGRREVVKYMCDQTRIAGDVGIIKRLMRWQKISVTIGEAVP